MLRFNLASLIRRKRRRLPAAITLPDITPTATHQTEIQTILLRVVRAWWEASRDQIIPAYRQALAVAASATPGPIFDDAQQLGSEAETVSQMVDRLILALTPQLRDWVVRVEKWHRGKWQASLTPTGISLGTLIGQDDVEQSIETTIQQNVALARSLSSEARTRIEGIIFRGFTSRTSAQQIAREISEAVAMSRRRAIGIAVDQTQKLSASLDTARMEQAGITDFEWVHSGKVHYRPWHRARNGKRFKLRGDIPANDMPGIPPWCGCRKKAVLPLGEE